MSQPSLFDAIPSLDVEREHCHCCGDEPSERYPVETQDCGHALCTVCARGDGCAVCLLEFFGGEAA